MAITETLDITLRCRTDDGSTALLEFAGSSVSASDVADLNDVESFFEERQEQQQQTSLFFMSNGSMNISSFELCSDSSNIFTSSWNASDLTFNESVESFRWGNATNSTAVAAITATGDGVTTRQLQLQQQQQGQAPGRPRTTTVLARSTGEDGTRNPPPPPPPQIQLLGIRETINRFGTLLANHNRRVRRMRNNRAIAQQHQGLAGQVVRQEEESSSAHSHHEEEVGEEDEEQSSRIWSENELSLALNDIEDYLGEDYYDGEGDEDDDDWTVSLSSASTDTDSGSSSGPGLAYRSPRTARNYRTEGFGMMEDSLTLAREHITSIVRPHHQGQLSSWVALSSGAPSSSFSFDTSHDPIESNYIEDDDLSTVLL